MLSLTIGNVEPKKLKSYNKNKNLRKSSNKYSVTKKTKFPTKFPTQYTVMKKTRFPTEFPTQYPVMKKTKFPTRFPTPTPTNLSDISNCIQWTCVEWCKLYDEMFENEYVKYGCIEDGDSCICE